MNHSWADSGYEAQGPGPTRGARTAMTVLIILSTLLGVVWYAKVGMDQSKADCYDNAPAGITAEDVHTTFRWFPPGYDCSYTSDNAASAR